MTADPWVEELHRQLRTVDDELRRRFHCCRTHGLEDDRASPQRPFLMPCSWAVYELEDGSVWLAKMNIAMMSKLFAGDVAAGMGEVAAADERFMAEILA